MNHNDIANAYIRRLILPSSPEAPLWNRESQLFGKPMKWNYVDACMIKALTMLYDVTADSVLLSYADGFMRAFVDGNGDIPTFSPTDYNLDNINGGKVLLYLYKKTGDERYILACDRLFNEQLSRQPRLECGNFWHKVIYPYQIWLDGIYMALPFMAEYGIEKNKPELLSDIRMQLENVRDIMRDRITGLYFHGYDESRTMEWADPKTGLSHEFWLRAMGWLSAALADLYELVPDVKTGEMLAELLEALAACQESSGMYCQLPARNGMEGNYNETSGTLLYSYSALKAYRLGISGNDVKTSGERALTAVSRYHIKVDEDGIPYLGNICLMAGLGGAAARDGSVGYYLSEQTVVNDGKGIAPYLMAYSELLRG